MMKVMPFGMIGILVSIVVVAFLYARIYGVGVGAALGTVDGLVSGACFGALIGIFVVCVFVIHNYVNLNIGVKLTVFQGIAYFFQWVVVGAAIGAIYKP
jgi:hypothetical protein